MLNSNNIVNSKSEARRIIRGKGLKLNDVVVDDENKIINLEDFKDKGYIKISAGKKKHYLIKIN